MSPITRFALWGIFFVMIFAFAYQCSSPGGGGVYYSPSYRGGSSGSSGSFRGGGPGGGK